jgi:hypothetical protein
MQQNFEDIRILIFKGGTLSVLWCSTRTSNLSVNFVTKIHKIRYKLFYIHNIVEINVLSFSMTVYGILSVVIGTTLEITRRLHRRKCSFGSATSTVFTEKSYRKGLEQSVALQ